MRARGSLWGVLAVVLLLGSPASRMDGRDLEDISQGWRVWEDLSIGAGYHLTGQFPVAHYPITNERPTTESARALVTRVTEASAHIRSWHPFGTIPDDALRFPTGFELVRRADDRGRALLLGLAFRALDGVAPYLVLWLPALFAAPVVVWTAAEAAAAGRPRLAVGLPLLIAASAFVQDALTQSYSSVGFYVLALLALLPLGIAALLGRPTVRGILLRAAATGALVAVCVASRGGSVVVLPSLLAAVLLGLRRLSPALAPGRRAAAGLLAAALLTLPTFVARKAVQAKAEHTARERGARLNPHHELLWLSLWQGLGDFDATKGHVWSDRAARDLLAKRRLEPRLAPRYEPLFRQIVTTHVREDPLWYAGILARRAAVTLTQWKLRAWAPLSGTPYAPKTRDNEGSIDAYYALGATLDVVAAFRKKLELPLPLLWLGPVGLVLLALRGPEEARRAARSGLLLCTLVSVAALPMPILVTTASAVEPQAFGLAYLLAAALLVEAARRREPLA